MRKSQIWLKKRIRDLEFELSMEKDRSAVANSRADHAELALRDLWSAEKARDVERKKYALEKAMELE